MSYDSPKTTISLEEIHLLLKGPHTVNASRYLAFFKKLEKGGYFSWNWAAFLFGPLWLAFRRMYGLSLLYLVWPVVFLLGGSYLPPTHLMNPIVAFLLFLSIIPFFSVFLGMFGNKIYLRNLQKKVQKGYLLIHKDPGDVWAIFLWKFPPYAVFRMIVDTLKIADRKYKPSKP